jgi:hypothetical protein
MQRVILTHEMLWSDYMAEVADTLNDFLGLSKEEHRAIAKLPRNDFNTTVRMNGGKLYKPFEYSIIIQGNGLVFLTNLVYLAAEQKRNFFAAETQVKEFQQEYLDKLRLVGTYLDA